MSGAAVAWAALYDAASLAFAYPDDRFYRSLQDDSFANLLTDNLSRITAGAALAAAGKTLGAAADTIKDRDRLALETEYVSLFEMGREKNVLHLHAHLYDRQRREQFALLRQLSALYAEFGLSLAPFPGREAPDHITVQLEFMSYLWRLWDQASTGEPAFPAAMLRDGIQRFHRELDWIPTFAARLVAISGHPFYVPLAGFTAAMVQTPPVAGIVP